MQVFHFHYQKEKQQNPFIGFTSFQHFRGDKLYSDVVVDPKNGALETENYEGYPIPDGVEEEGASQGFHPDSSVAYIRVLWKEFEPKKGEYNFALIENILDEAKKRNQTVMFRLVPHSTNPRDDVPDWLKSIVDCPVRMEGKRIKTPPKDEIFAFYFLKAVKAIGLRFDSNKTLDVVDIALPVCFGEGEGIEFFTQDVLEYVHYVNCTYFKNTKLIGQIGTPELVAKFNQLRPIGWRADGVGLPLLMEKLYPAQVAELPKDVWKKAPISFEAYFWISHWYRMGWDIDALMDWMLEQHVSTFNNKSFPIPNEWKPNVERALSKMGYHFVIRSCEIDDENLDDSLKIDLTIENVGVAPIYNKIPLRFRLKGEGVIYDYVTDVDIRAWLPGMHTNKIEFPLPEKLRSGAYEVEVAIFDEDFYIFFATDAIFDGKFYSVGHFNVK